MKGQSYITEEGEIVHVQDFDSINKMAYVHISSGQFRWYTEAEYSQWRSTGTANIPEYYYVPDIPAQSIEQPKTKEDAVQVNPTDEVDVLTEAKNGEGVGEGNTEHQVATEESEVKGKEKVKRTRTKKETV